MGGFDIISDIHGQGDRLASLLDILGYSHGSHPDGRKIIFLGDFIHRGAQQAKTLDIVRNLMARGTADAVMGNHELSLLRYLHEGPHGYVRPHTEPNDAYHASFFREFPIGSDGLKDAMAWMRGLKIALDLPGFNVVHAFWSKAALESCHPYLDDQGSILESAYDFLDEVHSPDTVRPFDLLTAGPKYNLPETLYYRGNTGFVKTSTLLYWWKDAALGLEQVIEYGDKLAPLLREDQKSEIMSLKSSFAYAAEKPLFYGNYSHCEPPRLFGQNATCLDFQHNITAYRWDEGDSVLEPQKLVFV